MQRDTARAHESSDDHLDEARGVDGHHAGLGPTGLEVIGEGGARLHHDRVLGPGVSM